VPLWLANWASVIIIRASFRSAELVIGGT